MSIKNISLILLSLTVVVTASCSSTSSLGGEVETQITQENFDAAIATSDSIIQLQPQNPLGYYYKGVALGQKGQAQQMPTEGTPYFKQMNEAFSQAKEIASQAEETPEQISRIENVKSALWRVAHNNGVNYVNNDSLSQTVENPIEISLAYLNNANIIQPNHAITYQALALVSGRAEKFAQAAEAQQKFINMADSVTVKNYLVLAQYYQKSDQPEKALEILTTTQEKYPGNLTAMGLIADTYTQMGKYEEAINLIEQLVEKDPTNAQYRLALGSRLLRSALELQEQYSANVDEIFQLQRNTDTASVSGQIQALQQENQQLEQQINQLAGRAEEQFNQIIQNEPSNASAYNNLGIIYQNRAAMLYSKRNLARSREQATSFDKQADDVLKTAMGYYEKAAEIQPDNTSYWRSLYQIYTTLGMDEKANEAAVKAGIQ